MPSKSLKVECERVQEILHNKGFNHLNVLVRGTHLIIYSRDNNEKINRVRLTKLDHKNYQLSMANHRGKWEPTPYIVNINNLITMLIQDFSFALIDFN
jgi:hypothetical protein